MFLKLPSMRADTIFCSSTQSKHIKVLVVEWSDSLIFDQLIADH